MLEAFNLKNNAETRYRCQVSVYRTIGPLVSNGRLLEAGILVRKVSKMDILESKMGGWAFIRTWAFIRDFTVYTFR